jgi:hypothetical protein
MTVRQVLPPGLAQLAPGPQLGVALAGLDLHALTGSDLVEVLRARARQLSHEQAQLLAVMVEIGLGDPAAGDDEVARLAHAPEYAADEIRAALAWTRNAAYREFHFAQSLLGRLPAVFTALDTGVICRSKAWLFSELCADLTDEQAQVVCDRLLPRAGELTTGELAVRIKKTASALDPEWAARRYARAVRDRDVIGYLDEDGTATVTGRKLPADQAAAACARIEDLAKAAKRAGYRGRIGPLRADIYLGLLDGRWAQRTREEIIADLLAPTSAHKTPQDPTPDADTPLDDAPLDDSPGPDTPGTDARETAAPESDTPESDAPESDAPESDGRGAGVDPVAGGGAKTSTVGQRVGVELRVGLSTLLGLDRHPGEIPGWGSVTAETACNLAGLQRTGQWRFAVTDPEGHLILAGITGRRPAPAAGSATGTGRPTDGEAPAGGRGGIVELQVPAALLTELAAQAQTSGAGGQWAAVIADIAAQYRAYCSRSAQPTEAGQGSMSRQDPAARFAGTVLRRHIQIRDRYCVYLGCRCPARHADLDHTIDHAHGGLTNEINIGPLCGHDHQLKHEGGWRLTQPEPGHFIWISPLGRTYHTRPQPISIDLPDPLPRPEQYPDHPSPATADTDDDGPILERPPPEPDPPEPADEPPERADEPPPF